MNPVSFAFFSILINGIPDAGASPTSSERGAHTNAFWAHDELFKNF
jgi:hypothetical protein